MTNRGLPEGSGDEIDARLLRYKLQKLIDQAPHAAGIKVESLRELLRDPEAFDA